MHADIVGERARLTPGKTALVCVAGGARYTYRDLDQRAGRMADAWLAACRFGPGDRVGLLAHNRVEFIDAFFAAARSGVILVPLGTRLTPHEIELIAQDAGLRAVMYGGEFAETVRALTGAAGVERWIALDEPAVQDHARFSDMLAQAPPRTVRAGAPGPGPEDPFCLLYTSGTTGKPKGVMVPPILKIGNKKAPSPPAW
jgi:fatty-acyl-CoA synthase